MYILIFPENNNQRLSFTGVSMYAQIVASASTMLTFAPGHVPLYGKTQHRMFPFLGISLEIGFPFIDRMHRVLISSIISR